ncbi:conserved hypothetical protein [Sporisorium reilianum SRZ2]|uniref:DDE-1 domain-containing protein n=1 Tax=Sporisorium reilianum (strain SRZ2) TaxID=999809 RepID=E6ZW65_SPORE|nr:conserved hypothetical protein [Sporisorium reilianum SRZ2]
MPRNTSKKTSRAGRTETAAAHNDHEEKIQRALAEWEAGQHASIGAAAAAHSVAKSTLHDPSKGKQTKQDAHSHQQALSPFNETTLLNHIRHCAAGGFLLNPADVRDFTEYLARGGSGDSGAVKLGHNWVSFFLNRHLSIQSRWSRCLENARIRGTDEDDIRQSFGRLQEVITEYKISSNDIFNMDETGFVFGLGGSQCVIVPGGNPASRFKAQPGNRQNATVIEVISSGGQVLPPLIITKGKLHTVSEQGRMEDIPSTWHFSKGPSGWTDNELAVLWVENVFDANAKLSMPSASRLLIMDGHQSHTSSVFIDALWKRNILPLCLPPHTTHVMQPLDVSIFRQLTAAYRRLVTELAPHVAATGIDKAQFGTLYAQAQEKTLTSAAAKKAFQDTGITTHPVPGKVLNRLAGSANAPRRSSPSRLEALTEMLLPRTLEALETALSAIHNARDARDLQVLKRLILEAFQAEQTEKEAWKVEALVLRAQVERNIAMAKKARPEKGPGDRMILSKDRMISREEAERELAAKQPAIDQAHQRARRRGEHEAAADDGNEVNDDEEEVLPSPSPPPPAPHTFLDDLAAVESLNAVDDGDDDPFGFFETLPVASSSRRRL